MTQNPRPPADDIFSDVLLVVHFNFPYYGNIPFLRAAYSPHFRNIVFYGEKEHPEVCQVLTCEGYYLSDFLQDVLTRFPNFKGYLFLQDDCVLNYWNCRSLNQEKVWFAPRLNYHPAPNIVSLSTGQHRAGHVWDGWQGDSARAGISNLAATQLACDQLSEAQMSMLNTNLGKGNIAFNVCDCFYIPHRLRESVLSLVSIFRDLFCEIAVPTMLFSLATAKDLEQLRMLWGIGEPFWQTGIDALTADNYPSKLHWIHPVKFSDEKNRLLIASIFDAFSRGRSCDSVAPDQNV